MNYQLDTAGEGTSYGFPLTSQTSQLPQMQQTGGSTTGGQQAGTQQMGTQQMGTPQMQVQPQGAQLPLTGTAPVDFDTLPSTPIMDINFTQGYLRSQIGARVKIEFLIGTNMLIDREGTLVDVGISYVVIREVDTDDLLLCDIYSIKFVRFYY